MLSKIAVVASLLMLGEGAIEVPLTKEYGLSKNRFYYVNNYNARNHNNYYNNNYNRHSNGDDLELEGGVGSTHRSYIAKIKIDNQEYRLICDTGSSDLLLVGSYCRTYPRGGNTCNPQTSSIGNCVSGNAIKNNYGSYVDIDGSNCYGTPGTKTFANYKIYKADVEMAGVRADDQYLGYIHQQTEGMWGKDANAVDGILGLAYESISSIYGKINKGKTLMSTLSKENGIPDALAMCFDPSGKGGKMIIGGGEIAGMEFTPLVEKSWYTVRTYAIYFDNYYMPNTGGLKAIVDSGTTQLVVPGQLLEAFAHRICNYLRQLGTACNYDQNYNDVVPQYIAVTADQLAMLPDITISLNGATLRVPAQAYFTYWGPRNRRLKINYYVYGIDSNGYYETPADEVAVILGDVALMGHWVYFDTANGRVGFSKVEHCNHEY